MIANHDSSRSWWAWVFSGLYVIFGSLSAILIHDVFHSIREALFISLPIVVSGFVVPQWRLATKRTKLILGFVFAVQCLVSLAFTDWGGIKWVFSGSDWVAITQRIHTFEEGGAKDFYIQTIGALTTALNATIVVYVLRNKRSESQEAKAPALDT